MALSHDAVVMETDRGGWMVDAPAQRSTQHNSTQLKTLNETMGREVATAEWNRELSCPKSRWKGESASEGDVAMVNWEIEGIRPWNPIRQSIRSRVHGTLRGIREGEAGGGTSTGTFQHGRFPTKTQVHLARQRPNPRPPSTEDALPGRPRRPADLQLAVGLTHGCSGLAVDYSGRQELQWPRTRT